MTGGIAVTGKPTAAMTAISRTIATATKIVTTAAIIVAMPGTTIETNTGAIIPDSTPDTTRTDTTMAGGMVQVTVDTTGMTIGIGTGRITEPQPKTFRSSCGGALRRIPADGRFLPGDQREHGIPRMVEHVAGQIGIDGCHQRQPVVLLRQRL